MVAIIDYDAGNIRSVENAVRFLGHEGKVTADAGEILAADHIILPGVGAFGDAMKRLQDRGLIPAIRAAVEAEKPFLGICLGLQLLFEESEESPGVAGLGLLPGKIRRIPDGDGRKVPQIGWNDLTYPKESILLKGVPEGSYVYFVHSYYLEAGDPADVAARTQYGVQIDAAVEHGMLFACQFHPEKSERIGMQILTNFLSV
ncbi:MAG: imidazole glycerol phosphate synthase subunit HisH [Eubacteriales bacterium]|nr:imidazole glycerol phosphate synthase subunit HisH [Eubacteriales bacterium]